MSIILNSLLSSLEAFVLTHSECNKLTKFLCVRSRALLRGEASIKEEGKHTITLTNVQVLRNVGMIPCYLELAVRRLVWLQELIRFPDSAGAFFAVWFGSIDNVAATLDNP